MFNVLMEMESEAEVTNFTICKIQSLVTHNALPGTDEDVESSSFQMIAAKFKERFLLPDDERLVNYYSCKLVIHCHLSFVPYLIFFFHFPVTRKVNFPDKDTFIYR